MLPLVLLNCKKSHLLGLVSMGEFLQCVPPVILVNEGNTAAVEDIPQKKARTRPQRAASQEELGLGQGEQVRVP